MTATEFVLALTLGLALPFAAILLAVAYDERRLSR